MTSDYAFFKRLSLDGLEKYVNELQQSYSQLYDMAHDGGNREAVFLKELCDILIQINAVTYVYTRDKKIHPNYALEKLKYAEDLLQANIRFWESKLKDFE